MLSVTMTTAADHFVRTSQWQQKERERHEKEKRTDNNFNITCSSSLRTSIIQAAGVIE